ncbi:ABC transporter permease [Methylovirgula sp. 4M-Z18]|uniref:ABC transporter permease n=1 Tax=Methylovirgula sp. 4M-Z18 TaxID=2293567 RepID=UPI000E2EA333|nr:ABC transporter permease [Methylovirgula sp. 4M-Z18]RFB81280.1 ABC transporter permease [Methylovirgula sp. 4M-Z18]
MSAASFPSRRMHLRGNFLIGSVLVALLFGMAVLSLIWTPWPTGFDALNIPHKLQTPSWHHWFGTDQLGRDILSLILAGARTSILVGVVAVGIGLILGTLLGLLSASRGGWIDDVVMRCADITFAFPALLSAIMLQVTYGASTITAIIAIGIFNIPVFARVARAAANGVLPKDYVRAARIAGRTQIGILRDHVLPNISAPLIVQATLQFANAILAEAALSYLGLGTQPPQASWGRMLNDAQTQLFGTAAQAPMLAIYPGAAIALAVLGLNLMGDGLRDYLDPRLARTRA